MTANDYDKLALEATNEYMEEIEKNFPSELLLIKEVDPEKYNNIVNSLRCTKMNEMLCRVRMNMFVDLAADATGRPYIIDTGSTLDVADALFTITDEWLSNGGKKSFGQKCLGVLYFIFMALFVISPIPLAITLFLYYNEPQYLALLAVLLLTGTLAALFHVGIERIRKAKRKL